MTVSFGADEIEYWIVPVPPVAITVIVPFVGLSAQVIFVKEVVTSIGVGSVIVKDWETPLQSPSITSTV